METRVSLKYPVSDCRSNSYILLEKVMLQILSTDIILANFSILLVFDLSYIMLLFLLSLSLSLSSTFITLFAEINYLS